jgi:hypothetical protein
MKQEFKFLFIFLQNPVNKFFKLAIGQCIRFDSANSAIAKARSAAIIAPNSQNQWNGRRPSAKCQLSHAMPSH